MRKKAVVDVLENYIKSGERGSLPMKHDGASVGRPLNPMRLAEYRKCPECNLNPVAFLTIKKVPICQKHWEGLADSRIAWGE